MDEQAIFAQRTAKVLEQLAKYKVDALLVVNDEESQRANTRWLCDFSGSSSLCLLNTEHKLLITDSRYDIQSRAEVKSPWEIHVALPGKQIDPIIALSLNKIGVIGKHISVDDFRELRKELRPTKLLALPNILSAVQEIKDEYDLYHMRHAIRAIESALSKIIFGKIVKPEVSELYIKRRLTNALTQLDNVHAFKPIIASGPNSALPHYSPTKKTNRKIKKGDIIQFDVGCLLEDEDYKSDISRVVVVGKATPEQWRMHKALLEAQSAALKFYTPGTPVKLADEEARRILAAYGYDEQVVYGHGLGHGLGLLIHEEPGVSTSQNPKVKFKVGQVVTCEPGIYREGWGGMRLEDDILITEHGYEILTKFTRDLIEI